MVGPGMLRPATVRALSAGVYHGVQQTRSGAQLPPKWWVGILHLSRQATGMFRFIILLLKNNVQYCIPIITIISRFLISLYCRSTYVYGVYYATPFQSIISLLSITLKHMLLVVRVVWGTFWHSWGFHSHPPVENFKYSPFVWHLILKVIKDKKFSAL